MVGFGTLLLRNAPLPQEAVYCHPAILFAGRFEILAVAALSIGFQVLLRSKQPGAHRIEVDVIANALEPAPAAADHNEAL